MVLLKRPIRSTAKPGQSTSAPVPAMPGGEQRQVKRGRLAAGLTVVAFSVFMGWLVINARGDTIQVWVATQDIAAGSPITDNMVVPEDIPASGQLSALTIDNVLEGRTTRLPIPAGSTLVDSHLLRPGDTFETADVTLVGLSLGNGEVPAEIAPGDIVRLIPLLEASNAASLESNLDLVGEPATSQEGSASTGSLRIVEATVRSVGGATSDGSATRGARILTVEVPSEEADRVALLAARGQLVVTIIGRT